MRRINKNRQPLPLSDGTILAASGTEGSVKEVESLSEKDKRRYVDTGRVAIEPEQKTRKGTQGALKEEK
jgi:hypothetical protein